ncbi:hypothetical protein ACFSL4_25830 [Streptomyces caeni]|uniref:Uncharacterized protein n=1 Tax=Streptomyces caeni TaxID=2307231 RepID=A0ABW4IX37_9ACTN
MRTSDREIAEAGHLIDGMTREDLEGPDCVDHCTEALEEIIGAKREGHAPPAPEPGRVLDLMSALHESVRRAQESRGGTGTADVHELPAKEGAGTSAGKRKPAPQCPTGRGRDTRTTPARVRHAGERSRTGNPGDRGPSPGPQ